MRSQETMMIEAQARIISRLREHLAQKDERIESLERELRTQRDRATYYKLIEDCCKANVVVASEWARFVGVMRLSFPDDLASKDVTEIARVMAKNADKSFQSILQES